LEKTSDKIAEADNSYLRIKISSGPGILPHFYPIFQSGFRFHCYVGKSIEDLLLRQLSLDRSFIEEKVNTIFLDGKCVDDISSAILKEGSIAAFSSALPGLAGATLRRGGAYACLRNSITHRKNDRPDAPREGFITVKLFNLLMGRLGKVFIEKGVVLDRSAAADLFKRSNEDFWRQVDMIEVGGILLSRDMMLREIQFADYSRIMVRAVMNSGPDGKNYRSDNSAMIPD
jgi:hypothetical protein